MKFIWITTIAAMFFGFFGASPRATHTSSSGVHAMDGTQPPVPPKK